MVEFLEFPKLDKSEYEKIKLAVVKELACSLIEKGEVNPWKYAIYYCSTA
ncbi:hypothetical protein BH11PLA2_BH11PLA2_43300 [soil metagenome]